MNTQNQIAIYETKEGQVSIKVKVESDSIWLSQKQMGILFDRDYKTISKHINNVFKEGELDRSSVVAKFATTAEDQKTYYVEHYNLDVIISVGYRVKSKRGTQFRIWANKILKEYLIKGYTVNEKQLKEKAQMLGDLKKVVQLQDRIVSNYQLKENEAEGLIKVIADYTEALDILDDYDHQRLTLPDSFA